MSVSTAERATKRFLLRYSYLGTRYKGLQRQTQRASGVNEETTVQSVLEKALELKFKLQFPPVLVLSSRTDKHVHAHINTSHVDLLPFPGRKIDPKLVTLKVNKFLRSAEHDIVLRETIAVPYWYHCQVLTHRRKYVYKIGVRKEPSNYSFVNAELPLRRYHGCLMIDHELDLEKIQQACELIEGFHDFKTFATVSPDLKDTNRHLEEISFVPDHDSGNLCEYSELYHWWNFIVVAPSFLYHQVRRIVSTALSVGKGVITLDEVSEMLNKPHKDSWVKGIRLHHGHALWLEDIEYDQRLLRLDIPPPCWSIKRPYLGRDASATSLSGGTIEKEVIATENK